METGTQTSLILHGVDFVKVNFSGENFRTEDTSIEMNIEPRVFYPQEHPNNFKIVMDIEIFSENFFKLEILALGNFELNTEITPEIKKSFINVNAPAIMFPYVRAFVSTFSSNLGNVTGHLLMPSQFFKGDLEELDNEINTD